LNIAAWLVGGSEEAGRGAGRGHALVGAGRWHCDRTGAELAIRATRTKRLSGASASSHCFDDSQRQERNRFDDRGNRIRRSQLWQRDGESKLFTAGLALETTHGDGGRLLVALDVPRNVVGHRWQEERNQPGGCGDRDRAPERCGDSRY
jgi:hypothetical protein